MADKFDVIRQKRKQREVPDEAVLVIEEEIEVVEVGLAVVEVVEEGSVIEEIEEGSEEIEVVEEVEEGSVIEVDEADEAVSEEVTEVEAVPRRPSFKVTEGSLKCCSQSISLDKLLCWSCCFDSTVLRGSSLLLQ